MLLICTIYQKHIKGSSLQRVTDKGDGFREKRSEDWLWKTDMLPRLYALQILEVDGECWRAKALFKPRYRGGGAALCCTPMNAAESP